MFYLYNKVKIHNDLKSMEIIKQWINKYEPVRQC